MAAANLNPPAINWESTAKAIAAEISALNREFWEARKVNNRIWVLCNRYGLYLQISLLDPHAKQIEVDARFPNGLHKYVPADWNPRLVLREPSCKAIAETIHKELLGRYRQIYRSLQFNISDKNKLKGQNCALARHLAELIGGKANSQGSFAAIKALPERCRERRTDPDAIEISGAVATDSLTQTCTITLRSLPPKLAKRLLAMILSEISPAVREAGR